MESQTIDGKEAAKYIGISYPYLLELASKGEIPHIKAGSRYLFRTTAIDKWMDEAEKKSVQPVVTYGQVRKIKA